jgi:hypothetical protein
MVDHDEDVATQSPVISRILHLLTIVIPTIDVARRRNASSSPATNSADAAVGEVLALPSRTAMRT